MLINVPFINKIFTMDIEIPDDISSVVIKASMYLEKKPKIPLKVEILNNDPWFVSVEFLNKGDVLLTCEDFSLLDTPESTEYVCRSEDHLLSLFARLIESALDDYAVEHSAPKTLKQRANILRETLLQRSKDDTTLDTVIISYIDLLKSFCVELCEYFEDSDAEELKTVVDAIIEKWSK